MNPTNKELEQLLDTAISAAHQAGKHALEEIKSITISVKNNDELVTQADAQCQRIIIDRIKQTFPDHGFVAEEGEQGKIFKQPPSASGQIWWVIDPIDGTNNFAHGMLLFTISIAAMYQGEPVVGVIFEPATGSVYSAIKGSPAQFNGRPMKASSDTMNLFSSVGIDSNFEKGVSDWVTQVMQQTRFRNLGTTALQLSYVAKGALVATVASHQKLWDIAAGILICSEAGAIVTDWQGRNILPFDLDNYQGQRFQVLAANIKTHAQLLKTIGKSSA